MSYYGDRDDGYARRADDEYSFRGASQRHRGGGGDRGYSDRRDDRRRPYIDRDHHSGPREHYPRDRDRDRRHDGWSDRDHVVREPTPPLHSQYPHGDEDVASGPDPRSCLLLIRRLKPTSARGVLRKGLAKKLLRDDAGADQDDSPLGAAPGSLRGIYFVCDRQSDYFLGYAFAEFHAVADAQAALRKADVLGEACTVASQRFVVDWADLNAFPIIDPSREDPACALQFRDDAPAALWRAYRDRRFYAAFEAVDLDPPEGYVLPTAAAAEPVQKKRPAEKTEDSRAKKAKPEPQGQVSSQFATWSRKQAELRAEVDAEEQLQAIEEALPATETLQSFLCPVLRPPIPSTEDGSEGEKAAICLLCSCILPLSTASAHVARGPRHRAALHDTAARDAAYARMRRLGVAPERTLRIKLEMAETGEYHDRAKMRRLQERAERRAAKERAREEKGKMKIKIGLGGNADEAGSGLGTGLGAAMLRKAGWVDGPSSSSGGSVLPEQNLYAAGVGLGHADSNKGDALAEANRITSSEAAGRGFAERTMEAARRQFVED